MNNESNNILMRSFLFLLVFSLFPLLSHAQQDSINRVDQNGKRHGLWMKKYANGNIRYRGTFVHGKETGEFLFYLPDNPKHPSAKKIYKENSDEVYVIFYRKNGKKESEGYFKNQKRTGTWKYYFPDGKTLMSTEEYSNGKKNGVAKIFYKNGTLAEKTHYKDGLKDGTSETFGINGKPLAFTTYRNGKPDGPCRTYLENGELYSSGQYKNGLKTGIWEFHIDGKIIRTEHPEWVHRKH